MVIFNFITYVLITSLHFPVVLIHMFVQSWFSPWNTDIALGAAEKKVVVPP